MLWSLECAHSTRSLFAHVTLIVPPALQTRKPNAALSAFPFFGGLMAPLRAWNGCATLQQALLADESAVKGGSPGGRAFSASRVLGGLMNCLRRR